MGVADHVKRGHHLSAPPEFALYRPTAFGPRSRKTFFADRRARWAEHFGGQLTDTVWMQIDAVIGLEWNVRKLEAKARKDHRELAALVNLHRQYRLAVKDLGVKPPTAKGSVRSLADHLARRAAEKAPAA
jgi:hypothetical protein